MVGNGTANPPDVDAGTVGVQEYAGTQVTYSAAVSDPDNNPLTWQWFYTANGGSRIAYGNSGTGAGTAQVTFNYPSGSAGTQYVWIVRATDNQTAFSEQSLAGTVIAPIAPPPPPPPPPTSTAPTLTVGAASGAAGTAVDLPITFNAGTASVASMQWDLTLPPSLTSVSVTPGAILNAAGKSVSSSVNGNVLRLIVFGLNQNTIASGALLTARLSISPSAAGTLNVPISGIIYSDPNGGTVSAGSSTDGTVTVTAPAPPPSPSTLQSPDLGGIGDVVGVNDTLSLKNGSSYSNVSFTWTFVPVTSAAGFGAPSLAAGAPLGTISFPAGSSTAGSLASHGVLAGTYLLTVQVMDQNNPNNHASASKTIAVVQSDLSQVKVYPNPWRKNRHDGRPVTFENLSANTTVKIFTISGHEVKSLTPSGATATWDLTTDSGDHVASGTYIYLIKDSQGNKSRGMLAVIR